MDCTKCGANLTGEDLQRTDCKFCGTVLPHHARAAEKAETVKRLLEDADGDGIPDALQGVVGKGGSAQVFVVGQSAQVHVQHHSTAHVGPPKGWPPPSAPAAMPQPSQQDVARNRRIVYFVVGIVVLTAVIPMCIAFVIPVLLAVIAGGAAMQ